MIVKSIKIVVFFTFFIFTVKVYANPILVCQDVDEKVDSLFSSNFDKMEKVIENNLPIDDSHVDRYFIYMLTYLSGIDCEAIDYSGFCHFTRKSLDEWKLWYKKNKLFLKWEKINQGFLLLKKDKLTDKEFDELDSLLSVPPR